MNTAVMFSKASDEWATPQAIYEALHAEFHFEVDAAATRDNKKCPAYYGLDHVLPCYQDALIADWREVATRHWCNPPYSRCREFVAKAAAERVRGVLTVMLVAAWTGTRWFHEHL